MAAALIRNLVEWVPTSVHSVSVLSGPMVLLGYLVGSIPFGELVSRERQVRPPSAGGRPPAAGPADPDPLARPGVVGAGALAALATMAVTTVAWDVALAAAPRGTIGAVGTFSNQAVGAWVSVALWTGMGAVVGSVAPVWSGFRGGSGIPPATALVVAYAPVVFIAGVVAFLATYALLRSWRAGLAVTLVVAVSVEYLAWIADVQTRWGVTNGPELTLWVAALAGVLATRNLGRARGQ